MARIAANIFALIELVIVLQVLFHWLANGKVLIVVHNICVCYILRMNTTTSFD